MDIDHEGIIVSGTMSVGSFRTGRCKMRSRLQASLGVYRVMELRNNVNATNLRETSSQVLSVRSRRHKHERSTYLNLLHPCDHLLDFIYTRSFSLWSAFASSSIWSIPRSFRTFYRCCQYRTKITGMLGGGCCVLQGSLCIAKRAARTRHSLPFHAETLPRVSPSGPLHGYWVD